MHKDSTGQMMNQVMTPFQQQFGKPCQCRATLSVWEKVCLCRGIWRILLGAVYRYPERRPVLWLLLSLNNRHTLDHVWPQDGPGAEVILASVCNWTRAILTWEYVTKHVLWNFFFWPCLMGKVSFQMNVQFTAAPNLEMLIGA